MRKLKHLMMLMLMMMGVIGAQAAETLTDIEVVEPGFFGRPLLAKDGYKAEGPLFDVNLGSLSNIQYIVDDNPSNYSELLGVANVTLPLSAIFRIIPDETNDNPTVYPAGTKVGFVASITDEDWSALDVDVVNLMVVYFYKDGELVDTQNLSADDLGVLKLNIANVNLKKGFSKIDAVAPCEFDGIGFGRAGVDAKVVTNMKFYYGFIDDFVDVPFIKKYFPSVKGQAKAFGNSSDNMFRTDNTLVNNNLSDGNMLIFGIPGLLNVGIGDVRVFDPQTEFPANVECGFVLSTGGVAGVNVGNVQHVYLLGADGKRLDESEQAALNVVGLDVIGGGNTTITVLSNEPFHGLEIVMEGLNLEVLKGTTVHYAYVRLPQMPQAQVPFNVDFHVIPIGEYHDYENAHGIYSEHAAANVFNNRFYLGFQEGDYIDPEATKLVINGQEVGDLWRNGLYVSLTVHDWIGFSLVRRAVGSDDPGEYVGCLAIFEDGSQYKTQFFSDAYTNSHTYNGKTIPQKVIDGKPYLDLSEIYFTGEELSQVLKYASDESGDLPTDYEYVLYIVPFEADDLANYRQDWDTKGFELNSDVVSIPRIEPYYQLAGNYTMEDLQNFREDELYSDDSTIDSESHRHYVIIETENTDNYKLNIEQFTVARHIKDTNANLSTHEEKYTFTLNRAESKWGWAKCEGADADVEPHDIKESINNTKPDKKGTNDDAFLFIHDDLVDNDGKEFKYGIVTKTVISPEYRKAFVEAYGENAANAVLPTDNEMSSWGWYPTAPEKITDMPTLELEGPYLIGAYAGHATVLGTVDLAEAAPYHKAAGQDPDNHILYRYTFTVEARSVIGDELNDIYKPIEPAAKGYRAAAVQSAMPTEGSTEFYSQDNAQHGFTGTYTNDSTHSTTIRQTQDSDAVNAANSSSDIELVHTTTARAFVPTSVPANFDLEPTYLATNVSTATNNWNDTTVTGVGNVVADPNAPAVYYNLQGVEMPASQLVPGVYLVRQGNRTAKVVVK